MISLELSGLAASCDQFQGQAVGQGGGPCPSEGNVGKGENSLALSLWVYFPLSPVDVIVAKFFSLDLEPFKIDNQKEQKGSCKLLGTFALEILVCVCVCVCYLS